MSETSKQADALLERALEAAKSGQREQATRYGRAALQLEPRHKRALHLLAKLTSDTSQKQALYRKIIAIDPRDGVANAYLAGVASMQPQAPRRPQMLILGVILFIMLLGSMSALLASVVNRPEEPLPTEMMGVAPTATIVEQVQLPQTQEATQAQGIPLFVGESLTSELLPTATQTAERVLFRGTQEATATLVQFMLPTETRASSNVVQALPTSTPPFIAPPVLPTNTSVSFVLPIVPSATSTRTTFVLPTATLRPSATSDIPFDFTPEPTSTRIPLFRTATPAPDPDLRTEPPPTDTQFEESPLSGGA